MEYSSGLTESQAAIYAIVMILVGLVPLMIIVGIITYIVSSIFLSKIFKKAGVESWIAWVPVYNSWKFLEIGGQQGFWAILSIIPIAQVVSVVFMCISAYHIGLKLSKDGAFVALYVFLPLIWIIWLGTDSSKWKDDASSAPSLAETVN